MEKSTSIEMRMRRELFEFLTQEQAVFADNLEANEVLETLKQKQAVLEEVHQSIAQLSKPYSAFKKKALVAISEKLLQLSGLLKSLALQKNNPTLAHQAHITRSDLSNSRLEVRIVRAQVLIRLMTENQTDFEAMSNGAEIYQNMLEAYQAFSDENHLPMGRRLDAAALRQKAILLRKEIKLLLTVRLDAVLRIYSLSQPAFYAAYLVHRRTNKVRSSSTKSSDEANTGNPTPNSGNPSSDAATMP